MTITSSGGNIVFSELPCGRSFEHLLINVDGGGEDASVVAEVDRAGPRTVEMSSLGDGVYNLLVFASDVNGGWWNYLGTNDVLFRMRSGVVELLRSPAYDGNVKVFSSLSTSPSFLAECLKPSRRCRPDLPEVRKIAKKMKTAFPDPYLRALACHDWVASHIAYDIDSLVDDAYLNIPLDQISVLSTGRSVCQGYADLYTSILRAAGIPALTRACFAIGRGDDGGWNSGTNMICSANHDFNVAYLNGRWVLIDVTWDSDLEYRDGRIQSKTGHGKRHKYFDVSLELLSGTHRFTN